MRVNRLTGFASVAATVAIASSLAGCARPGVIRPDGDGGWSAPQRNQEVARALALPAAEPTPEMDPARLDLATVLRMVSDHNPRITQGERQLDAAAERVNDSFGRFLPATTGSGRYTWYSEAQSTSVKFPREILQQLQLPEAPNVKIRDAEAGVFNGTVLLPLDLSGELRHALRAAQAGYRGERARLWATTLDQETAAVRAYFQLLEAQRLLEVTQQTIAQVQQQLQQTQGKFDNGRVTKNELLVVQVAARNLDQQRMQRQLAIDQARWTLNQLAGRRIGSVTEVTDVASPPTIPEMTELLQSMQQSNPLATALLEEQQRLEESATALERSRWPRFASGAAIDYTTSDIARPQQVESGFVGLTVDLGTDLRREAQIAEARAMAAKNRAALTGLLQELEVALRNAQGAALERLQALRTAQTAVEQAEENLRIRQQQFDNGRVESDKVLEAETLLYLQRAGAASALYQSHIRRAELQQLIGLPLSDLVSSTR